jgi:hypothetical protein
MKFCKTCGTEHIPTGSFCMKCGTPRIVSAGTGKIDEPFDKLSQKLQGHWERLKPKYEQFKADLKVAMAEAKAAEAEKKAAEALEPPKPGFFTTHKGTIGVFAAETFLSPKLAALAIGLAGGVVADRILSDNSNSNEPTPTVVFDDPKWIITSLKKTSPRHWELKWSLRNGNYAQSLHITPATQAIFSGNANAKIYWN